MEAQSRFTTRTVDCSSSVCTMHEISVFHGGGGGGGLMLMRVQPIAEGKSSQVFAIDTQPSNKQYTRGEARDKIFGKFESVASREGQVAVATVNFQASPESITFAHYFSTSSGARGKRSLSLSPSDASCALHFLSPYIFVNCGATKPG